ncbi:MAG: hypothetical protein DMG08_07685 [Acidobacteria bacterium]|nr:MAG: hypothetical protein DMG08_07685 [Acidobacteriota bacterium]
MPDLPASQAFPSNLKSQIISSFKLFSNFQVFLPYPQGRSCMAARRLFSCNSRKFVAAFVRVSVAKDAFF